MLHYDYQNTHGVYTGCFKSRVQPRPGRCARSSWSKNIWWPLFANVPFNVSAPLNVFWLPPLIYLPPTKSIFHWREEICKSDALYSNNKFTPGTFHVTWTVWTLLGNNKLLHNAYGKRVESRLIRQCLNFVQGAQHPNRPRYKKNNSQLCGAHDYFLRLSSTFGGRQVPKKVLKSRFNGTCW